MQIHRMYHIYERPSTVSRFKSHETYLMSKCKSRAKFLNREFNLTIEDFFIPPYCPALGYPLMRCRNGSVISEFTPSIDRIDNSKGYIKGNTIIVSHKANSMKGSKTLEDLQNLDTTNEEMIKIKLFYKKFMKSENSS